MHSLEAWENDPQARQCLKLIGELPYDVSSNCLPYMAMFRSGSARALAWTKALRLLSEFREIVSQPYVQWDGRPARPSSPRVWAQALERIADSPPKNLPLKSHGYLRSIAYQIADEIDRKAETRRNQAEKTGTCAARSGDDIQSFTAEERRRRSPEEYAVMRQLMKTIGKEI
jgi:hypothetical protein